MLIGSRIWLFVTLETKAQCLSHMKTFMAIIGKIRSGERFTSPAEQAISIKHRDTHGYNVHFAVMKARVDHLLEVMERPAEKIDYVHIRSR